MKLEKLRYFIFGVVFTILVFALSITAYASYQRSETLNYSAIRITLNGNTVTPTDANGNVVAPFTIDGTTYLPVRAIANIFGYDVRWIQENQTVAFTGMSSSEESSSSVVSSEIESADTKSSFTYPLNLYSNDGKVYLGKLVTNKYDSDSIWNEFGTYGNKFQSNSIWNEFGTYGSEFSVESAFNKFASKPPKIVDNSGKLFGYLTANESKTDGYTIEELRQFLINEGQ